jgi:hypothetical protein
MVDLPANRCEKTSTREHQAAMRRAIGTAVLEVAAGI